MSGPTVLDLRCGGVLAEGGRSDAGASSRWGAEGLTVGALSDCSGFEDITSPVARVVVDGA
ncbi:hypothetical protein [Corynebacterium sp. TAE3-ERU16]|uniref:hypothetical protein n=1 Tax=Corynebacterium sp. TAE3-ERU16 TaxID=2849493 RepID=UPI001C481659|nr:hypothetical protein [Corynebacterium sp. TAE3-ERU16]MBV7294282.1 hypothetical protein [Corynebacterium sp. TAE3-ERU16]